MKVARVNERPICIMRDNITFYIAEIHVSVLQDSSDPGWGPTVGCYERSNKHSHSIKDSKFLDQLSDSFSSDFKYSCFRTENKLTKYRKCIHDW
jgi:hypothetical protein